jgi:glycine/D-amino acid oxidase-like deaminating enzyme
MSAQHDVVVIGGGAIGRWAAYSLKTRSRACRASRDTTTAR